MSTRLKVVGFLVGLAAVFAAAFGVGAIVDQDSAAASPSTADRYVVRLEQSQADPGRRAVRFTIDDRSGNPVTQFDVRHEKRLHLIAVNNDFGGYQHVHPTMTADGTWSTDLDLSTGVWRVYADFQPAGGQNVVAHADLEVSGASAPAPELSYLRTTTVDGFTVTALGDLASGTTSRLTFEISRAGAPVEDLEPYLGSYGHLVMLRAVDMAYQHVHPENGEAGPDVEFMAEVSRTGTYHLYLDFKHDGVVRTAHFVIRAGNEPSGPMDDADHGGDHDSH
jgi:hypothetical protein